MLARMDVTCIMAFVELHSDFLSEGQTVKQFLKQTGLPLVSQRPNKAKPDSQSVNTNDPDYLDCLTVDRPVYIRVPVTAFAALSNSRYKFLETGVAEAESGPDHVLQKLGA